MGGALVLAAPLAKSGEAVKSGPIGLAIILILCIACYFLFKSMSKHLKTVREDFPADPQKADVGTGAESAATAAGSAAASTAAGAVDAQPVAGTPVVQTTALPSATAPAATDHPAGEAPERDS